MYDLFVSGTRLLTSDEIADALLEYARVLSAAQTTEAVTFPALLDGQLTQAWVTVGMGIPLVAARTASELPVDLPGHDLAAWEIRRRTDELSAEHDGTTDPDQTEL